MISVTKLLFAREYFGDSLRYTKNAHAMRNGAAEGVGPVVVWNSTKTCNLRCMHCYMQSDARKYQDELSTEEAKRFIDDLADFHVPVLLFSGGEPLIRPDFFELAAYAQEKGVRPTLSTNGTLITRDVAQKIKDIGVGYVGISLDGLRDVNDKFRGVDGAYEKAMQGIKNCVAVGQRVGLRFTINHHNIQELDRIFDFIEEEGINRVCFYHLVYSGRGEQMMDQDVTPEESRRAMDTIIRRTKDFEERGLKKEILTVDNHCDGPYMYLKALEAVDRETAAQIKKYISDGTGGTVRALPSARSIRRGTCIPISLPSIIRSAMCASGNSATFGRIPQIPLWLGLRIASRSSKDAAQRASGWKTATGISARGQRRARGISGHRIRAAI